MKRTLALAGALAIALTMGGCAVFGGSGGGQPTVKLTLSQKLDIAKGTLAFAKTGLDAVCTSGAVKMHFCTDNASMQQINAVYTVAQDAISDAQAGIAAYKGNDPHVIQTAIDKAVQAIGDYENVVDAFKRAPPG